MPNLVTLLAILLALAMVMILGLIAALRYIVVNLYMPMRRERDLFSRNRDEWRTATERSLLMASVYKSLAERATTLAVQPVDNPSVEAQP